MRAGGIFHPNFFYAPRRTTESSEITLLEIYRVNSEGVEFVPGEGNKARDDDLVWKGYGRFQPNKDWRSRPRERQYEYTATHAVRIQIPIGKNLVGAEYDEGLERYTSYGPDPKFIKDMRVEVVENPVQGFENWLDEELYIRNAIQNQNLWHYNLLCDTGTSD